MRFGTHIMIKQYSPQQQTTRTIQNRQSTSVWVFVKHNTTKDNRKPTLNTWHNPKFEIWSVFISSLILNTTELTNKSNKTYTSQSPTNKTQPTPAKHQQIKTQPMKTSTTTKTNH